ncbi:glycoside hydrolase family 3 C-terminal domain-containing protein [Phenylobacterium sp. LjRoot219]|uniref:glycoside hydrolase family 3 N-terminal domain-containing protein n=1 Tax=Phenylobacterium sp. LjRoot219 TaxID=3342283 RepID=UPI003ECDCB21
MRSVSFAVLAGAWLLASTSPAAAESASKPLADDVVRTRADALIAQMTPEEKAGQLGQYFYFPQAPPLNARTEKWVEAGGLGSVLMLSDPVATNRVQRIAVEKSRLKIPVLFGFDVVHGLRTIFPVPLAMAASWDPALVEETQRVAAREARAVGIHWTFAPMLDIGRDPRWGRIVEGPGEDPYLASAMAAAQVRGFQGAHLGADGRVIAGPKHFVGYGAALGGRDYDEVALPQSELWNVHFPPFKAAVDAGAGNVMSAYMALNGVPASGNQWLLTTVLRETWGFKGFIGSDAGGVIQLTTQHFAADAQDAAVRALKAGVDMEMGAVPQSPAMSTLPAALQAGKISEAELDAAVRRVLEAKIRMGLFEKPYVDEGQTEAVLNDPKHLQLARTAAERSAVLLRNEKALLPLDRKKVKSIAVIGPLADSARDTLGPWVFPQNKPKATSVLAGLKSKLGPSVRIDYSEGVRMARTFPSFMDQLEPPPKLPPLDETAEIQRAVAIAKNADVAILVLGEHQNMIGESASRASLAFPGRQQELLDAVVATGKPVVLVLMSARPISLTGAQPQAVLDIFYPGSAGGEATANLLFGDATPSGKLPFTWIRDAAQAPNHYGQLISHQPENAQKRYWDGTNAPTYPFGYGLSYTTFEYANLKVERPRYRLGEPVTVTVDVKNAGARAGDEVAQLYLHQRWGTSARPARELKGFQRVALKPGETKTLRFKLEPAALRYWTEVTQDWVQDQTTFDVWVGGSSTAKHNASFEVREP